MVERDNDTYKKLVWGVIVVALLGAVGTGVNDMRSRIATLEGDFKVDHESLSMVRERQLNITGSMSGSISANTVQLRELTKTVNDLIVEVRLLQQQEDGWRPPASGTGAP